MPNTRTTASHAAAVVRKDHFKVQPPGASSSSRRSSRDKRDPAWKGNAMGGARGREHTRLSAIADNRDGDWRWGKVTRGFPRFSVGGRVLCGKRGPHGGVRHSSGCARPAAHSVAAHGR